MKYLLSALIIILTLAGCKKDEELMSGNIEGNIFLQTVIGFTLPDQDGIQVDLYMESEKINTTKTDEDGKYVFEDLPYGRYVLRSSYPGFIRSYYSMPTFHVGGYSPTVENLYLNEVPDYNVQIDSVSYYDPDDLIILHLKINGDTVAPGGPYLHQFRACMGNSPGVTKDNYAFITRGIVSNWNLDNNLPNTVAIHGRISEYDLFGLDEIKALPIYMVIYPIANNQGYLAKDFLPESIGSPSNEVVFNWDEITGE